MSSTAETRALVYSDREHCICVHGSAVLAFSLQAPNAKCLEAWTATVVEPAQRASGPISILIIVDSSGRAPDEATKKEIALITTRYASSIGAFAYVIEGEGFGAAAIRSALSLISLAARYPFPQKVFKSADAAATWIVERAPPSSSGEVTPSGILSAVEMMRRQLKPLAAAI